jgi:DNA-binding NtrC family response regulator
MKIQHIVVVNDQPEFLELMRDFLEMEGYDVLTIAKHQGAFEQIKRAKPHMVICDLVFGKEVAGWALIDMLYFDPETRAVPLVICSAAVHQIREAQSSLSSKGIKWLEKPVAFEELLDIIHYYGESMESNVRQDTMSEAGGQNPSDEEAPPDPSLADGRM